MIDLSGVAHHPAVEEIVGVLCAKTQNTDRSFFRTEMAFFLGKMASNMRATILTKDRGEIPVNIYALALATSGFGKGHSVNLVENEFMKPFKRRFMEDTLPTVAERSLWEIANERSIRNNSDAQEEFDKLDAEHKRAGAYPFTFDSGTVPAVKQLRQKLLLSGAGAISLQIDEIGSNLIGNVEVLNAYLELFDQGIIKNKLTKNTAENQRGEEVDGKTPTNLLLFGTPAKLLDGGPTEDQFYSFLDTGYARRCIFGIGQQDRKSFYTQDPAEIYEKSIQPSNTAMVQKWSNHFHKLADVNMFGWRMTVPDEVAVALVAYKIACDKAADLMAEHEEIKRAEISHRYFKALKLAGAYAFVDQSTEVEMTHLLQAVLLVEESGEAFQRILNREKAYVKLAKYIAAVGTEVTHADLNEALPFYKSGQAARTEMMTLATAWGYKKHIIIRKRFIDGIEFFSGETLRETSLQEMILSWSSSWAYDYQPEAAAFDQLHALTQAEGLSWSNHAFVGGHRAEENVIPGFNMVVLDVDKGTSAETAAGLLREYKFMIYTTKRHTDEHNRFRLILPINYHLALDSDDYKEFMNNLMAWLPFETDECANQRSKKWESHAGGLFDYNMDGEILDALPFIPKTSKNEQFKTTFQAVQNLDNLERWFAQRMVAGNRNNHLIKYALALVDSGHDLMTVSAQVHAFNAKLDNPLSANEITTTIMATVAKRFHRN